MAFKFDIALSCDLTMFVGQEEWKLFKQIEKEKAWEEIFKYLDDEYETKTSVEKKEIINNIFFF